MPGTVINCYEESTLSNFELPDEWRSQSALDELAEYLQLNWEQRGVFYEDGEITSKQQYLGFLGQKGIRTNNYVGTISFKGQQINIFPKVFKRERYDVGTEDLTLRHLVKNLAQWIEYCNKVDYPFIRISSLLEDSDNLKELFITLYLHYVKSALDLGAFYRYEDKEEDVSAIRGHINFKDYIIHKIPKGINHKFNCTYSEFEFDNIVNRIIKYVCKELTNSTSSRENQLIIRYILLKMNEVSDEKFIPSDCDGIRLSKMHRKYSIILSMSKMFLLNQTSTYSIDNNDSFCFLFPTELLFQGFISGFLESVLQKEATVRLQASDLSLISDILYDGQSFGKAFNMQLDILVDHPQRGLFILDTKYKHMTRFEGNTELKYSIQHDVSQGDLYQVIEYAAHRDIDSAYLLYPMYRYEKEEPSDVQLQRKSVSGKMITVHLVRLPFVFEEDNVEETRNHLTAAINRLFD